LFYDSGDEVIPSGSGRCLEDDAICSMILVMMSFLKTEVKVKLQGKWNSAKNVVSPFYPGMCNMKLSHPKQD